MAGGLIQLVAYGLQDLYLTGEPQITFFKIVYRRHTNFSVESLVQNFSSGANFGEKVSCILSRSGDLVSKIFLYVEIPSIPKFLDKNGEEDQIKKIAWVHNLGYALIQDITLEIGDKVIDKQYGEWMYIWSQVNNEQQRGLDKMIGNVESNYTFSNGKKSYKLYIPLEFFFCKHNGLALPLVALVSSDVKISVTFRKLEECYRIGPTHSIEISEDICPFMPGDYIEQHTKKGTIYGYVIDYDFLTKRLFYIKIYDKTTTKNTFEYGTDTNYRIYNKDNFYVNPVSKEFSEDTTLEYKPFFTNCYLYVNYVYLDNEERKKFSTSTHEYLIEQIQFNQNLHISSTNIREKLNLNHPSKAFYWVAQLDRIIGANSINDLYNYTDDHRRDLDGNLLGKNLVKSAFLQINGQDRFCERTNEYFNLVEPFEHHKRGPIQGINVYSPSLYPEDHQPSSTINMSKIDDISMNIKLQKGISSLNTVKLRLYTINYNILRIGFGLGSLAFV